MLPIRKVKPYRVALTSYYNKTFVDRSTKAANDYGRWAVRQLVKQALDRQDTTITDAVLSQTFRSTWQVPFGYSMLGQRFARFQMGQTQFELNYDERHARLGEDAVNAAEHNDHIAIGRQGDVILTVDSHNVLYRHGAEGPENLGLLTEFLGLDDTKAPVEMAEMSVSNKKLPVGVVLGYRLGLSDLMTRLNCEVQRFTRGTRYTRTADEYVLAFEDEVLVFSRLDRQSTLILSGFNVFKHQLKQYSVWDFDRPDVYYQLLEAQSMGVRYLREMDTLFQSWVDPITQGILEDMDEPTTFEGLLFRSTELLLTDYSLEETDSAAMRYRGYERMAGAVYSHLTRAAKTFNARASTGENAVDINPHAVWQAITEDPTVSPIEERNPIRNLREQEVVTYSGEGGRSGRSMVRHTRKYMDNDVGTISEATVDSGDVGVISYFSPDANLTTLRGQTRRYDGATDGPTSLLSSSALVSPTADHDDQLAVKNKFYSLQTVRLARDS